MGCHISWLAVRGKSAQTIRSELGLAESGEREVVPVVPEANVVGCDLPGGWYLVFFNDPCAPEIEVPSLERLSHDAEVISCVIEEGAMISMASEYRNGSVEWSVLHDSTKGLTNIEASGHLPDGYESIRDSLLQKQAGTTDNAGFFSVDYVFDLPPTLAKQLTGFKHDECVGGLGDAPFVILLRL